MAKRGFAETWWGRAWVDALEHSARLDPNRLPRGRTYARTNRVEDLQVAPGEVRASVWGRRRTPYKVRVRVRTFSDAEWAAVTAAVATKAAHAAALVDGELDPGVVEDARSAGVALLPDAGDLQPRCSCPDWADPCKHSAAVCYLVAGLLDGDPFRLLELRGRRRPEVLAAVRRARAREVAGGVGGGGPVAGSVPAGRRRRQGDQPAPGDGVLAPPLPARDKGMAAADAWRRPLAALPAVPPAPAVAGRPAPWHADPPDAAPFTADGLRSLVSDAAGRAAALATGAGRSGLDLDEREDLARRADAVLESGGIADMARRAGCPPTALVATALAWRHAGAAGLRVLDEDDWRPPTATMVTAREALVAAGLAPSKVRVRQNRVALGPGEEVRLARDGRWYRFAKRAGRWEIVAPPADAPDELVEVPG